MSVVTLAQDVRRLIVIGVLLFGLTPMNGATAEVVVALLTVGPVAADAEPEHGCTSLAHDGRCGTDLCRCCADVGVLRDTPPAMLPPRVVAPSTYVLEGPTQDPDVRDLLRPPAA